MMVQNTNDITTGTKLQTISQLGNHSFVQQNMRNRTASLLYMIYSGNLNTKHEKY
jgi:hypothetical protein